MSAVLEPVSEAYGRIRRETRDLTPVDEPLYVIVYADGVRSCPLLWQRVLYDIRCVRAWGVARMRPVRVERAS